MGTEGAALSLMRIITVNKAERGLRWRCACGIHIGIPGGSLGAGGTTSSRDTLQRGGEEGGLLCICKRAHGIGRPRCHPATVAWEPQPGEH